MFQENFTKKLRKRYFQVNLPAFSDIGRKSERRFSTFAACQLLQIVSAKLACSENISGLMLSP
jgi:hypothetical protein